MKPSLFATAILVIVVAAGCHGSEDDSEPAFVPKAVAFVGNADPKYVGTWKSADGSSVVDLRKDGSVQIDQTVNSVKGKSTSHVQGAWLASGTDLLFKYGDSNGGETTLRNTATLTGNSLTLKHGQLSTSYTRK